VDVVPLAAGFISERSDWIIDGVLVASVVLIPMLLMAFKHARAARYLNHRNLMLITTALLVVAVTAVEMDLRAKGMFAMTEGSRFYGTPLLEWSAYIHIALSTVTGILWCALVVVSWFKFPRPPRPIPFGRYHRWLGRLSLIGMALVGITGFELYVVAFVL
jgi:hypothetical protein